MSPGRKRSNQSNKPFFGGLSHKLPSTASRFHDPYAAKQKPAAPQAPPRKEVKSLPAVGPGPALRRLLTEEISMEMLCEVAESVPRLNGVLRYAARRSSPRNTAQAILALGQNEVTVLSILLLTRLHFVEAATGFVPDQMLVRCLRRGVISMQLAQTRDDLSSADAFVLGLFQDIGTLQLSCRRPDLAPALEALQHHSGEHRSDAEELLSGRDHVEELLSSPLGALLSKPLRAAISTHHRPDHPLAAFTKAVDAVADVTQVGPRCEDSAEENLKAIHARSSLEAILKSSEAETVRLAKLIRLPLLQNTAQHKPTQVDALSSLANHSQLIRDREAALSQNQYGQQSMSVILLNVDRFQLLNEFYGHPAGDLLLRTIAERISDSTRLSDRLGRLGSDVFCMILPDTNTTGGQVVAERIRTMVERTEVPMGDVRAGCSISLCGVTISPGSTTEAAQLLQSLEETLETSRNKGRNHVYWQQSLPKDTALSPAGLR